MLFFFVIVMFALCLKLVFAGIKVLFITGSALITGLFLIPILLIAMFVFWGLFFFIIPIIVFGFLASKLVKAIC